MSRLLIALGAVGMLALSVATFVFATPPAKESPGRAVESRRGGPSVKVPDPRTPGMVSYNPGVMSAEAMAVVNDPKNKGKAIGMVKGEDGKLQVDKIYEPGETITPPGRRVQR